MNSPAARASTELLRCAIFYIGSTPLRGLDAVLALGRAGTASAVMIALTFVAQYLSSRYMHGEWRGPGDFL